MLLYYKSTKLEDVSDADLKSLKELIRNNLCHGIVFLPGEGVHDVMLEPLPMNIVNVPAEVMQNTNHGHENDSTSSSASTSSHNKRIRISYLTGPIFGNSHK